MIKSKLRAALRVPPLVAHCAYGVAISTLAIVDNDRRWKREQLAQGWHRQLLKILGINVRVVGAPASGARILVSNHISWMDIPVMAATEQTRFVSKAEVKKWPIAGTFADGSGTFYLERGAGATKQLADDLRAFVQRGGQFIFFPEGTTGVGDTVMRFHSRLFSVAVETGCPVQPMAVRYAPNAKGEHFAPFVGDDDMLSHMIRVLQEPRVDVEVHYLPVVDPAGKTRKQVAEAAQLAIESVVSPGVTTTRQRRRDDDSDESLAA